MIILYLHFPVWREKNPVMYKHFKRQASLSQIDMLSLHLNAESHHTTLFQILGAFPITQIDMLVFTFKCRISPYYIISDSRHLYDESWLKVAPTKQVLNYLSSTKVISHSASFHMQSLCRKISTIFKLLGWPKQAQIFMLYAPSML